MRDKAWNHTCGGSDSEISALIQEFPGSSQEIGQVCMPQLPPGLGSVARSPLPLTLPAPYPPWLGSRSLAAGVTPALVWMSHRQ